MKKLALVLGSLLVVGSVASAKEVMPAPVAEPEVKVVEKPVEVIVYRDREVEAPAKWRPNGYVSVIAKTFGEIENTNSSKGFKKDGDEVLPNRRTWKGSDAKTRLEVKANANITEKQNLEFRLRDWKGLTHRNNADSSVDEYYLQHTYNFGKVYDKVGVSLESRYQRDAEVEVAETKFANVQSIRERVYFDFADYLFNNDYIKTTKAVIAPEFKYSWTTKDHHAENYGLYADYQANIIGGVEFEAEFDNLYSHTIYNKAKDNDKDLKGNTGSVELTLNRPTTLYAEGKHKVVFEPKLVYATSWAYNKNTVKDDLAGIKRTNDKTEKWGNYTAKFEPILTYSYQATEYVGLSAAVAAEYVNRNEARHSASHWRWQPYAELGMKVTF